MSVSGGATTAAVGVGGVTAGGSGGTIGVAGSSGTGSRNDTSAERTALSNLTDAKDRGQFSATSAMSVLNVGLLREIIRMGDGYPFYIPLLVLIPISILLQVAAGALSIMIANMKADYQKLQSVPRGTCRWLFCCCKGNTGDQEEVELGRVSPGAVLTQAEALDKDIEKYDQGRHNEAYEDMGVLVHDPQKMKNAHRGKLGMEDGKESISGETSGARADGSTHGNEEEQARMRPGEDSHKQSAPQTGIHRLTSTQQSPDRHYEDNLIKRLVSLMDDMMKTEGQRIETQLMIPFLNHEMDTLNTKLAQLKQHQAELETAAASDRETDSEKVQTDSKQEVDNAIRQVETQLRAITQERDKRMKRQMLFDIDEQKLNIYRDMVRQRQSRAILEKVTYWQHVINYILYGVFVINAFITTFSFLSEPDE